VSRPDSVTPRPLTARAPSRPLTGVIRAPGDKSISHRALMLGGLAVGETVIHGLLEGEDVLRTAAAMRAMGATVERQTDGIWRVNGRGIGGLNEPADVLDMGNAGTGTRLLMGVVATHPFTTFFSGDASLRSRPMARVTKPLEQMGARFVSRDGGKLPAAVIGTGQPIPIAYKLPVASAQVKSAILLAGLNTRGRTTVIEPGPTRDHTERMLRAFGAEVDREERMHECEQPAGEHCCQDSHDPASALVCAVHAPEGAHQHHPLEADVDDAASLREHPADSGKHEGRREDEHRCDQIGPEHLVQVLGARLDREVAEPDPGHP